MGVNAAELQPAFAQNRAGAEMGMAFRRALLERGDSRDPAELYAAFMGRPPSEDALFARAGLAS